MPPGATEPSIPADVREKSLSRDLEENNDASTTNTLSPRLKPVDAPPGVPEKGDRFEVRLEPADDPKNLPVPRKWLIIAILCSGTLCATCASSMAAFAELGISRDLHVGREVAILGVSLFVLGLGIGPLLVGPLSEVYGRNPIYRLSYAVFFAFSFPVAFAPDIAVFLVFRFLTGFASSAFLSVAGGSVSDLFDNTKIATPMAVYTGSPFIGPVLGPVVAGFINQNTSWRWTFRIIIIWTFAVTASLVLFVPETYVPYILKAKAARLRRETSDDRYWSPLDKREYSIAQSLLRSCYVPFQLLFTDAMALLLDLWSALLLGILYLTFQAFPIIFEQKHDFSIQLTGLTFLGIGVGMITGLATQPLFNKHMRKVAMANKGNLPMEERLIPGKFGALLVPISLYWLAFTTYSGVHWIVPIIASVPFGTGIFYCFTSIFTYTVTAYRPIAASAMAANTFVRTSFAAAFPLFAGQMYDRLGTVGATALLAGLTTLLIPLPFVFYRIGARLRANSRFGYTG